MVIKGASAVKFAALEAWHEYAREHNLKNPYRQMRGRLKFIHGETEIMGKTIACTKAIHDPDYVPPTQEEIDNWDTMQDDFVDKFMLEHLPWNEKYLMHPEKYRPCESLGGQCNMFCKEFGQCYLSGTDRDGQK